MVRAHWFLALLLPLGLLACNEDTDGDGLTDKEEEELGTDPEQADTDGDGLKDGREQELGTDPLAWDTDGDTYGDGDEVHEGTDPTDPESRIYTGYWPYNPDKDSIDGPDSFDCHVFTGCGTEGTILPRFQWNDQYGEPVDDYDFAGHGRYIAMDVSGYWCGYCTEMAKWLAGDSDYYETGYFPEDYAQVRQMVQSGDLYWITILDSWGGTQPAQPGDAADWAERFPNDRIPVLEDPDFNMQGYFKIQGYPFVVLMDENMQIVVNTGDYTDVFDEIIDLYPDWEPPEGVE